MMRIRNLTIDQYPYDPEKLQLLIWPDRDERAGVYVVQKATEIPQWVQERIAILLMSEAGVVPGVGIRRSNLWYEIDCKPMPMDTTKELLTLCSIDQ